VNDFKAVQLCQVPPNVFASTITPVLDYLHPPSHGEGSDGDGAFISQPGEHDAELIRFAWFELHSSVQYDAAKGGAIQRRTLRMVYPEPEGRISH